MRIKFKNTPANPDHSIQTMLDVQGDNEAFIMNVFNLFMVELLKLHGPTFTKVGSIPKEGKIEILFTHQVSAEITP